MPTLPVHRCFCIESTYTKLLFLTFSTWAFPSTSSGGWLISIDRSPTLSPPPQKKGKSYGISKVWWLIGRPLNYPEFYLFHATSALHIWGWVRSLRICNHAMNQRAFRLLLRKGEDSLVLDHSPKSLNHHFGPSQTKDLDPLVLELIKEEHVKTEEGRL